MHTIHLYLFLSFLSFSYQFSLFLSKILKNSIPWPPVSIDRQIFVIVTQDGDFVETAKEKWAEMKQPLHELGFEPGAELGRIIHEQLTIFIEKIYCPQYGTDSISHLKCMITKLNKRWGRNTPTTSR